jgi:hypothetical protein
MGKELRMDNGDVDDADERHRLAGAKPATQPADAPRDENDDPIFETDEDE